MDTPNVGLDQGVLADLLDPVLDVPLGLGDDLLDLRRMDPTIRHELLEALGRDRLPDPIEAGHADHAGGVIDHDISAGRLLDRSNVSTLPADDAAFEVIGGDFHGTDGRVADVLGGISLDRQQGDFAALFSGPLFSLFDDFLLDLGGFMLGFDANLREKFLLGLIAGHFSNARKSILELLRGSGSRLKQGLPFLGDLLKPRLFPLELLFAASQLGQFGVEGLLALVRASLSILGFAEEVRRLLLGGLSSFGRLGLDFRLDRSGGRLGIATGCLDDRRGLGLGGPDGLPGGGGDQEPGQNGAGDRRDAEPDEVLGFQCEHERKRIHVTLQGGNDLHGRGSGGAE